jgi:TP901 family phage tail tape measure protein
MADVQSNIHVNIDTSDALASLKLLQRQISAFHTQMAKSGTSAAAVAANQAQNLMNSINATGQFQASMRTVTSSTESFTNALEKNKLTSREYFRYTGAATKTFGRLFRSEFETINKVARERVKDLQTQYIKMGRGANGALQAIAVRPLTLDMQNLGTQTAMAAQKQQLLNQLLKQGSTNLLNFGKNTQWAGRQLMVGFTVPLVMLGSAAAKTFMQMEEQAIRFKRVYGDMFTTKEQTDRMVQDIQQLAREYTKYGVAVEETMKMAADAAAMGKVGADLTAQVAQATRLAVLGGVEQSQALETTISITNAFGTATEDLAKKINFLNSVENQTVVSIEDLTIAIPKAGPVVQQLGGDVEDLAFFLTAMKEGGINASEGANALKSGLASLINPSEKASKFLAGLGVNIKGIVEANAGDVKSTVVDFANALDTLDPLNRARAIEQLFGKFQFSRLSTLFQNVVAEGSQASRVLELTKATTEELAILSERELGKIEETTTYKFKKAIEDLKVTLAPVGEQFLKALTPIVEFVAKILDKFNDLGDGSKRFITILTVALGAVGPVALMAFGLLANGVANIIKMFASLRSVFTRAGSSTQILGQQTDYLTQQQIEASAVAASLDQVHQKLRQTFTSEATAVNTLASAYRRAIAAQAGFTGPAGKAPGGKGLKKYSTGTTKVPGTGNEDTVFSMLTPGEAVIPAKSAQDPDNRPVIRAMIAGKKIQGYNGGTDDAQEGVVKSSRMAGETQKFHVGAKNKMHIDDILKSPMSEQKALTLRLYKDILTMQGIEPKILVQDGLLYDFKSGYNQAMSKDTGISFEQWEEEWKKRGPEKWKPSGINAFDAKTIDSLILETIRGSGPNGKPPTHVNDELVRKTLFETIPANNPKITSSRTFGLMKALHSNIASFSVQEGFGGKDPESTRKVLERAKELGIIQGYEYEPGKTPDKRRIVLIDNNGEKSSPFRGPSGDRLGTTATTFSAFREAAFGERNKQLDRLDKDVRSSPLKESKPEKYGTQIAQTSGRSFTALKGLGGVYETADNKKVFVKPANSYREALAEQRATTIARRVHGLDAPEQTIKTILDPTDPKGKRRIVVLESAFDPRFDPEKMSNKFTQEEYIKQNVAAALRGDKDLGRGNLGGNVLADVGPAGVFATASGERDFAQTFDKKTKTYIDNLPSMEQQARINLGIDDPLPGGGRKRFFAVQTKEIVEKMTADQYQAAMKKEIQEALNKIRPVIDSFGITDPQEKAVYEAMEKRLQAGLNADWKGIHQLHSSIAIKPGELFEDEKTEKLTKPKTKQLPKNVESSQGKKDTLITTVPKGKRVVQGAPRRVGKTIIPGAANAPEARSTIAAAIVDGARGSVAEAKAVGTTIGTTLSQSAALASRSLLYGTGPIDANAKSLRRQIEKRQRIEARTQAKAAASKKALYGDGEIDAIAKSKRRNAQKRSRLEQNVGMPGSVITAGTAESAQRQTLSSRLKSKFGTKYDEDGNKIPRKMTKAGVTGGAMAASGAAMMASMIPGQIGEMAQKIMMPLMGLSMILPMLSSAMGIATIAIGALVAGIWLFKKKQDDAIKAEARLVDELYATTKKMQQVGEITGKVGASELSARKRESAGGDFSFERKGAKFGSTFLKSEAGKADISAFETRFKAMPDIAMKEFSLKLASYVSDGVIDAAQATSIADQVGIEFQDKTIGIKIQGQLQKLLTSNGKDITKEPFEVRIKIAEETVSQFDNLVPNLQSQLDRAEQQKNKLGDKLTLGMTDYASYAITREEFDAIEKEFRYAEKRVDSIKNSIKQNSAFASGMASQAYEAIQAQIDGIEVTTSKTIDKLKADKAATKDLEKKALIQKEIDLLEQKRVASVGKLRIMNDRVTAGIEQQLKLASSGEKQAFFTGSKEAVKTRFKGTRQEGDANMLLAKTAQIKESVVRAKIEAVVSSGQFSPGQASGFINLFTDDDENLKKTFDTFLNVQGIDDLNKLQSILGGFEDQKLAKDIMVNMSGLTDSDFQAQYSTLVLLQQMDNEEINIEIVLKDPKALAKITRINTAIEAMPDVTKKEVELVLDKAGMDATAIEKISENWEYFAGLPSDLRKTALQTFTTLHATIFANKESRMEWARSYAESMTPRLRKRNHEEAVTRVLTTIIDVKTGKFTDKGSKAAKEDVLEQVKDIIGLQTMMDNLMKGKGSGSTDEKAKIESSPLDDLVKKLKNVRKNQIKFTEGWIASFKTLNTLFGKNKTVGIFSGIENDLRDLGAGENLIDLITGMTPEEFETYKDRLFDFDANGNITGIKDDAQSIQDALDSIRLGEFVSDQEKMARQIGNQVTALNRLRAAGIEGSVALEAVADATFAAAIANKNLDDRQIKEIADAWRIATAEKRNYAAIDALTNEETGLDREIEILKKLTELMGQFTKEQLDAIMSSAALKQALIDLASFKPGDAGFEQFLRVLRKTLEKEKIQLNLDKNTIEGMQKIFDQGFATAMERVDVKEKKLTLQFEVETEDFQNKIDKAQDQIDLAEYEKDDKEAALREIEKQEEKINEKYDERIKALDEVEKANAAISAQQKGQLSLAEALTSGDIAAAARAAQDMRAQAAADAVTKERDVLEKSRERELSKVTEGGKTRKQLETRIKELEDTIFNLEEKEIEPNQENIRKKNVDLREQVKELDKVRRTWEQYQNAIDEARVNNKVADKAIADALEVMPRLKEAYRTQCPPGFMWDEGIKDCIPIPEPIIPAGTNECPDGTTDDGNGNCVATKVADPGGATPCVANAGMGCGWNMNGLIQCDGTCEGGEDPGKINTVKTCPKGQEKNAQGNCVPIKKAEVTKKEGGAKTCAAGETLVNGKCVKKPTLGELNKNDPMFVSSALHREELARIAADNKKNQMLFQQNMNVRDVTKNAGNTPGQHLQQFYKMQNDLAVQKAMAPTPGMLAQDKAVKEAAARAAKAAADKKAKDAANLKNFGGNAAAANAFGNWPIKRSMGGLIPKYFSLGGFATALGSFAKGTDTVPAMLTPGEFIMSKYAVETHGINTMKSINSGQPTGGAVYNNTYTLTVNAKTDANPNDIAQAVMSTIKRVDDRRIRGVSLNGR